MGGHRRCTSVLVRDAELALTVDTGASQPLPAGSQMPLRPANTSDLPDNLKYSKWDHIEVSDDEGDSHPNIDQKLMARLKKEKRQRDYEEFR